MTWHDAVLRSLSLYRQRHGTSLFERQPFLDDQLAEMVAATGSSGLTPHQTVSRVLQELRDEGAVEFVAPGRYLMLHEPLPVEREDLDDQAIDLAIRFNRLTFSEVETADVSVFRRQRRGQRRLSRLSRRDYRDRCAVCDVEDDRLLIASHIVRWADAPEHRGNLHNILCLCRMHDALFEYGYWSLNCEYSIVLCPSIESQHIQDILSNHTHFTPPDRFLPDPRFLHIHHERVGLATGRCIRP